MKNNKNIGKLGLNKQTIAQLDNDAMKAIGGGNSSLLCNITKTTGSPGPYNPF